MKSGVIIGGVLATLLLGGCFTIGQMVGGPMKDYSETYSIELPAARADILDVVTEVGQSLGYDVKSRNREAGQISLFSSPSFLAYAAVGSLNGSGLDILVIDGGKVLRTTVSLSGNFGAASPEKAQEVLNTFKSKLLEKIAEGKK